MIEKCEKKLTRWKSQYISLGGRVTLINSVLDALLSLVLDGERRQGSGEALTFLNEAPINTKNVKYLIAYINIQNHNSNNIYY